MKKYLLVLFCTTLLFTANSCKKESDAAEEETVKGSDSYQPATAGSYWKYSGTAAGVAETSTFTVTGKTKVFNNKTYVEVTQASQNFGNQTGYFYIGDGSYAQRASTYINGITVELQYLKTNLEVGSTWTANITDNGQLNGIPARIIGKVLEKDAKRTVNGKSFANVIHTSLDLQYNISGFSTVMTYEFYVAKGVGIIEIKSTSGGTVMSSSKITEYKIK